MDDILTDKEWSCSCVISYALFDCDSWLCYLFAVGGLRHVSLFLWPPCCGHIQSSTFWTTKGCSTFHESDLLSLHLYPTTPTLGPYFRRFHNSKWLDPPCRLRTDLMQLDHSPSRRTNLRTTRQQADQITAPIHTYTAMQNWHRQPRSCVLPELTDRLGDTNQ